MIIAERLLEESLGSFFSILYRWGRQASPVQSLSPVGRTVSLPDPMASAFLLAGSQEFPRVFCEGMK